jgi:sterol desaturase/sphingolipid hydroxylase (fatty acid hydroxylase superfamily)
MFKYGWMEIFSKVHFSVPLFIYIPVIGYFLYQSFINPALAMWQIASLFAGGILAWTILEYFLHRYVFHFHPKSEFGKRIMFVIHGVHHDYPNDSKRLVMPPSLSIPLAFGFYFLYKFLVGDVLVAPFFAGTVLGYLVYDMLHYSFHHLNWDNKWFMQLKSHHLKHHFKDPDLGFGVSSTLWDKIVGTDYPSNQK